MNIKLNTLKWICLPLIIIGLISTLWFAIICVMNAEYEMASLWLILFPCHALTLGLWIGYALTDKEESE